jgi:lambda family phage portal protein
MFEGIGRAVSAIGKTFAGAWSGGGVSNDGIGLEAGRMGRRLGSWIPSRVHVNTLISQSGPNTLARARFLARNNGYASSAVECFAANLVGAGIKPSWKSPLPIPDVDEEGSEEQVAAAKSKAKSAAKASSSQKQSVHALWARWTNEADAEGITNFYGLQKRVARELFIAGEIFGRLRPRRLSDGLSIPMQIELFPSEQLPLWLTMPRDNGNWIRQGIEFDKIGRRVAYHFWRVNPGDITLAPKFGERVRIPADQILHVFDPMEAGQIRGISRLTPAIVTLWMLDLYDDAELERKKTAALFSVFVVRPDPDGEFFDKETTIREDDGAMGVKLEPGSSHVMFPGEDIKIASPADVGNSYEPFQYRTLTRVCAALGLPYAGTTGDLTKANYSNQRAAMIEARRRAEGLQNGIIIHQFCLPVFRAFMDSAHIGGALDFDGYADNPRDYLQTNWIPPRWMWIDPLKDRQAEILAVTAGFKARSQTIEEEGGDAAETDQRIAEDAARADRLGINITGVVGLKQELGAAPPTEDDPDHPSEETGSPEPVDTPTNPATNPAKKTTPPKPNASKPRVQRAAPPKASAQELTEMANAFAKLTSAWAELEGES